MEVAMESCFKECSYSIQSEVKIPFRVLLALILALFQQYDIHVFNLKQNMFN